MPQTSHESPTTTPSSRNLGKLIRKGRTDFGRAGLSQSAFARLMDVDQSLVSKWERGLVIPTLRNLHLIAQYCPTVEIDKLYSLATKAQLERAEGVA